MKQHHLPDTNRLSVLVAIILLAYALARFIDIPGRDLAVQFPGVYFEITLNINTIVAFLVAGLTATGADWLLRQHPSAKEHSIFDHWLLPSLTSWVIGIPLFQLSLSPQWWLGFIIGGILLTCVLIAEYITIDPEDERHPLAAAGLTALSFALFLSLAISLRFAGFRLFLTLPALSLGVGLISLRTLHLRLHGRWAIIQSATIALTCAQITAALHYMPVSPVSFGLFLLAPSYAFTSAISNLAENKTIRASLIEPLIVLSLVIGTAIWIN
ncbi:MAG: hypothetical protein JSV61_00345 [Anaerolineales bacterium]|nr:MAG: hypothetical protein JSV61_00345 [Anaerolineales bacterium]